MRIVLSVVGVLLMLVGAVWFLQGINILPGSFMTGQTQWAIYGGVAFVAGAIALYRARRMSRP
jgi:hypothetical protein